MFQEIPEQKKFPGANWGTCWAQKQQEGRTTAANGLVVCCLDDDTTIQYSWSA